MIKPLIVVAGILAWTSAQAATLRDEDQSNTLEGPICEDSCDEAFTGSLWLDEDLLPGGTIAGSTLNITYNSWDDTELSDTGSYSRPARFVSRRADLAARRAVGAWLAAK